MTVDRRRFLGGLVAAGVAAVLPGCSSGTPADGAAGRLRIATGSPGAVFHRYGSALAAEAGLLMPGVRADALVTTGSVDNDLALDDGRADVAFSLGDTAALALAGTDPFTAPLAPVGLARLYDSFLQVVVRRDSPVRTAADLAGRRVADGGVGSGGRVVLTRCLDALGISGDVELLGGPLSDGADLLRSGRADALSYVSGYPVQALVELGAQVPLRALDLGDLVAPLVAAHGPLYVAGPLPATAYGLPEAVRTVAVTTYLLAAPRLSDAAAYGLCSVVFDRQGQLAERVPDVRQPTLASGMFTQPVPLHPGALQWFRDRARQGG
ncbi:TAXI family TRAP transporter solute-binding subunit [Klenkia sp. LSe6-5]|uniref:TAXI family TRAP transporter solute-binding subunit n=1 Tax=Klenkia sesuvii TaxID=3103137 RepID=A0ABU8DTN8_9ACTN